MTKQEDIRRLVVETLIQLEKQMGSSHLLIRNVLDKYSYLEKRDRAFYTRMVQGTIQYQLRIDYMLDQCAKVPVKKQKPAIRAILRSAVYQLEYMDSVPDRAVCSEAVRLACAKGFHNLKGFVNGVLRGFLRQRPHMKFPDPKTDLEYAWSVQYAMPQWIVGQWRSQWGDENTKRMLEASLKKQPMTVACNPLKCTPRECAKRLRAEGVKVEPVQGIPFALRMEEVDTLANLASFKDGWFQVQDTSSMMAVLAAGVNRTDTILDVCAAPGGKTLLMAAFACQGQVTGRDISEAKLPVMEENKYRMGHTGDGKNLMDHVTIQQWDSAVADPAWEKKADIVLADVPCSGLGVLHKKSDLKYHITRTQQEELADLQRKILEASANAVKPGGTLVYSTCTVNKKENEENFRWFLATHSEYEPVDISNRLPLNKEQHPQTEKGFVQLLPGVDETDGFFIGCMKRKK